jgi:hypothetical protein
MFHIQKKSLFGTSCFSVGFPIPPLPQLFFNFVDDNPINMPVKFQLAKWFKTRKSVKAYIYI